MREAQPLLRAAAVVVEVEVEVELVDLGLVGRLCRKPLRMD